MVVNLRGKVLGIGKSADGTCVFIEGLASSGSFAEKDTKREAIHSGDVVNVILWTGAEKVSSDGDKFTVLSNA